MNLNLLLLDVNFAFKKQPSSTTDDEMDEIGRRIFGENHKHEEQKSSASIAIITITYITQQHHRKRAKQQESNVRNGLPFRDLEGSAYEVRCRRQTNSQTLKRAVRGAGQPRDKENTECNKTPLFSFHFVTLR